MMEGLTIESMQGLENLPFALFAKSRFIRSLGKDQGDFTNP